MQHRSLIAFVLLLTAGVVHATTSARTNQRLAPGDIWCPTGLTFDEGRPGLQPSAQSVFDRGDLETSFRSPSNGWVYVTLQTTQPIWIDNVMMIPRNELFPPATGYFDSTQCYQSGAPNQPTVRVHAFDPAALPGGTWLERFEETDEGQLRDNGWDLGEAMIDTFTSAVENLSVGDPQATVTLDCTTTSASCPDGTNSLYLPAGARVRFPAGLMTGADYVLQVWWKGPAGARVDVRVDDFSACPAAPEGVFIEHATQLEIEILSAELKRGIDPDFWAVIWIEDESDTFGRLTVDGAQYDVPQIDNEDRPTWDGAARFAIPELSDPSSVSVKIEMFDNDEFDNAHVDLDVDPTDRDLDLTVDLCRMTIEGDLSADMQGVIEARGDAGSGDDQGLLRFRISTPSQRPLSTDDLAVVDVDFVQAVHGSRYAVTERRGLVMVSVANNFSTPISTEVLVEVYGPGSFWVSRRFPVTLDADSTETFYFFEDAPIFPPGPTPGVESSMGINVHVDPDGVYTAGLPTGDCRLDNDLVSEKFWKLVELDPLTLTYCKVGRVLDATNLVSDAKYNDVKTLGTDYIRAVFPTTSVSAGDCAVPMAITPTFAALDFISAALDSVGIPFSSVLPFALVWDMNNFAMLSGTDKLLGVLPNTDWYGQFDGWENVSGNSLGEAAPHAVIFLPEVRDDGGDRHVQVSLPGHELAHTFGVSSDPRLKDTSTCGISYPVPPFLPGFGDLICGATGGIDEYSSSDPARERGNPATGFWIETGLEDPRLAPFAGQQQCDRHCFMGRTGPNQLGNWAGNGRWIDVADWEHLIRALARHPDPAVLHVSGMIDGTDSIYLGPWFRLPAGVPDRIDGDEGLYHLRFLDANNSVLQDVGFPARFQGSDHDVTPPITFFGFSVPWVDDAARIDLVRLGNQAQNVPEATLASRPVSEHPPTVVITDPPSGSTAPPGGTVDLVWAPFDADGDALTATVMASVDGDTWSVVHGWVDDGDTTASIPSDLLPVGDVLLKVVVTDGVHLGESQPIVIHSQGPLPLFADDFESGDTSEWSSSVP